MVCELHLKKTVKVGEAVLVWECKYHWQYYFLMRKWIPSCYFTKKFTFNKTHMDKEKSELVFPDAVDIKLKQ